MYVAILLCDLVFRRENSELINNHCALSAITLSHLWPASPAKKGAGAIRPL